MATSQCTLLEERAANASALLTLELENVELEFCPNCGDAGGEPREFYDAGDRDCCYGGGYEKACSLCVNRGVSGRGSRS